MAFNEALRQKLLKRFARDQEMRKSMTKYKDGAPLSQEDADRWEAVDIANTQRMQDIVTEYGWPVTSLVGQDGAQAAWLLVQHADKKPDFQKQCLELLQEAVEASEASPKNMGYLLDRVRVNFGQPQVYGTQCHTVDGELVSREIENAEQVDQRRAAIGLGLVAEYLASMRG